MDNDQEEYTVISLFTFRQIALWFFVAAIASCVGVFLLYYYKEKFDSPILPFNCLIIFFLGYFIGTYLTTIYRINNINLRKLILFIVPIIIFPLSVFYVTLLQLVIIQIIYWVGVIFGYLHFLIGGGKGQDEYKTTELLIDRLIYEANRYHDSG